MQEADPARSRHPADDAARPTPEAVVPRDGAPRDGAPRDGAPRDGSADEVPFAPDGDWVREQRSSLQYAGVGMQFGFTICLFALLGRWLDGRFGTGPWLLLLGVALGFGGGTYSLLKKVSSGAA